MMVDDNSDNRFWIEVKCKCEVTDYEWAELLMMLNLAIDNYDNGRLSHIGAYLCEDD